MLKFNVRTLSYGAILSLLFVTSATVAYAYSYAGWKWPNYPVAIQVQASWPSGWVSPLASAMGAWNAASSPFYFNTGNSGHLMYAQNRGSGYAPGESFGIRTGSTITDVDTVLNTYYAWSTSGEANKLDVQSVVTHELGHWLTLLDLSGSGDTAKTMYFMILNGETKKRTLESDDLNGINYIYP